MFSQVGSSVGQRGARFGRYCGGRAAIGGRRRGVDGPAIHRRLIGQCSGGDGGGYLAVVHDAQQTVGGDAADLYGVESPFAEDGKNFLFAAAFGDQQTCVPGTRSASFRTASCLLALRYLRQIELDAHAATRGHFTGGAGESRGAHVLYADDCAGGHGFKAGLEQQLFEERIADLHVGALLLRLLGKFRRGKKRCAMKQY